MASPAHLFADHFGVLGRSVGLVSGKSGQNLFRAESLSGLQVQDQVFDGTDIIGSLPHLMLLDQNPHLPVVAGVSSSTLIPTSRIDYTGYIKHLNNLLGGSKSVSTIFDFLKVGAELREQHGKKLAGSTKEWQWKQSSFSRTGSSSHSTIS